MALEAVRCHSCGSFMVGDAVLEEAAIVLRQLALQGEVSVGQLLSHDRTARVSQARMVAIRRLSDLGMSVGEIATLFGRHRTSIYYYLHISGWWLANSRVETVQTESIPG